MNLNTNPLISIVTVTYNAASVLEKTILSVINQTYSNIEYIVIDGGSTDGTIDIIKKYQDKISYWVSEADRGIYDAMNKGIIRATGEWINFMNAGDCFSSNIVLESIFDSGIPDHISFIYSDFYIGYNTPKKLKADYHKGVILHQSVIYRRKLHEIWGNYIVTSKYIVSDYLFFMQIPEHQIYKTNTSISINDQAGVSAAEWCLYQKICIDYFFRRISFFKLIRVLIYVYTKNILAGIFYKIFKRR